MLYSNILVPYDESEHARGALRVAMGLAGPYEEATVHVITVMATGAVSSPLLFEELSAGPSMISFADYESLMESATTRAREELARDVGDACQDARCKVIMDAVVAASPVEGINDYVTDHQIDLVVMGRRGLGALRGMLGSVSFGVLRSVEVPVLTVK